jgi:TRAP-type C4-dicarboxylate transport system permease small subunit
MREQKLQPLVSAIGAIACSFFLIVVAMIAYEVVSRYFFDSPTIWSHELSVMLCAAAFLLGGPYVHQHRSHIIISIAAERFSPHWRSRANVLVSLLTFAFFILLTYATVGQAIDSISFMEQSGTALNWPIPVIVKTLFAFVAAFMTLQSLLQLSGDFKRLK